MKYLFHPIKYLGFSNNPMWWLICHPVRPSIGHRKLPRSCWSEVKSLLGNRATWLRVDLSPSVFPIKSRQWLMPCFRQILRIPKKMTDLIRHGNPTGNRQYRNQKNIYSNLVLFLCPPCLFLPSFYWCVRYVSKSRERMINELKKGRSSHKTFGLPRQTGVITGVAPNFPQVKTIQQQGNR